MKHINDTISCLYDSKLPFSGNLSIGLIIPPFQKNDFYCHAVITAANYREPCGDGVVFLGCKTMPASVSRPNGLLVRCTRVNLVPATHQNIETSPNTSPIARRESAI
jgi:hypothetical protein